MNELVGRNTIAEAVVAIHAKTADQLELLADPELVARVEPHRKRVLVNDGGLPDRRIA